VGDTVRLPLRNGPRAAELRRALLAVEHALGGMPFPELDVALSRSHRFSGGYGHDGRIVVSRHAEHLGLALVHELGHALDHLVLGGARLWASETEELAGWWRAVGSSAAYRRLRRACTASETAYWPSRRETFARSFSQWVAHRSRHDTMRAEIERRAAGAGRQWEAADFDPIARALDRVLLPL
jgi:hypothetical protein